MFAEDALSDDRFLDGRVNLLQPRKGFRASTDAVLLAAACDARAGQSVLDLGCGAGAASLCLGARVPGLVMYGLELQADYADLARRNAARNAIPIDVHEGDVAAMPAELRTDFDHVMTNPPYYPPAGTPSPLPGRALAMQATLPLTAWAEAATRRVVPGGYLTMICGAGGLPDVLAGMGAKMGSVTILPLAARTGRAASRILVQARKGGRAPFRLLSPLILHVGAAHEADRESYTPEIHAILRGDSSLLAYFR